MPIVDSCMNLVSMAFEYPLDPKYEYRQPGGRKIIKCVKVVHALMMTWPNTLHSGKITKISGTIVRTLQRLEKVHSQWLQECCCSKRGKRQEELSDLEFARYIFNLAGVNCTTILDALALPEPDTTSVSLDPSPTVQSSLLLLDIGCQCDTNGFFDPLTWTTV